MTLEPITAQNPAFVKQLVQEYPNHREQGLQNRRFTPQQLDDILAPFAQKGFDFLKVGESYQGRDIKLISIGTGTIKVLMWSQMHGDEATATMALADIFNYLSQQNNHSVQELLRRVTLYFIPMLNPDGARRFQRRTAQGIDMNRDALALQCPESRILKKIRDDIDPDFGFNLHDQNDYYTVGLTGSPATISFLAPAFNPSKDINAIRRKAMQVIIVMNRALQQLIPGQVARYDDSFEPRAFGDNIQKWGTSTILVESGPFPDDPEKQQVRLMNYVALLTAIYSIASSDYSDEDPKDYASIPENHENLNDLLIKNLRVPGEHGTYELDVAIRHQEFDVEGGLPLYYAGRVEDAGDLRTKYGYTELPVGGRHFAPAKIYPEVLADIEEARKLPVSQLLTQGYTAVRLRKLPSRGTLFPLDLVGLEASPGWGLKPEQFASFLIKQDSSIEYAVINGFVHKIGEAVNQQANGWIFR